MKYLFILALPVLIHTTCSAQKAGNDLIRYGLKGKVKMMEQIVYPNAVKVASIWTVPDTPSLMIERYYFDKKGKLTDKEDINEQLKGDKKRNYYSKMKFRYDKDGRIAGSEWYDANGHNTGASVSTWTDSHTYVDSVRDSKTKDVTESIHILDKKYRNKQIIMKRWEYKKGLIQYVITDFIFDRRGQLTGQVVNDSQYHFKMGYKMEVLETDKKGNVTKQTFESTGEPKMPTQLIVYKYEYYKD